MAFLVYNDGIGTIIRMATTFGTEIGLEQGDLITAIMLVQFIGIPFAFLFGQIAAWVGAKRAIFLSLAVYVVISVLSYRMTTATEFYVLALLVGMVQGGSQALSRSLFASMVPRHKSSEFFGFFGVFEKFAGIVGPGVFAVMILLTRLEPWRDPVARRVLRHRRRAARDGGRGGGAASGPDSRGGSVRRGLRGDRRQEAGGRRRLRASPASSTFNAGHGLPEAQSPMPGGGTGSGVTPSASNTCRARRNASTPAGIPQ